MRCRLIVEDRAAGSWNMAVDEVLLNAAAERNECALRFYGWAQPTLSLGYFQRAVDRQQHAGSLDCPLVRRFSGGGAIVHDREITYSLALCAQHPMACKPDELYQAAHRELISSLQEILGLTAQILREDEGEGISNQHVKARKRASALPFLCFQRKGPGDVLLDEAKICGSAQRRRHLAILQHGSVLLGASPCAPELRGLEQIMKLRQGFKAETDIARLTAAWADRLGMALGLKFLAEPLSRPEIDQAMLIEGEKYASPLWNEKR